MPHSLADGEQEIVEFGAFARIESGGRFVKAKQHRIGAHGAGDFETALRAIGQFAGGIVGPAVKSEAVEPFARAFDRRAFGFGKGGKAENPSRV